MASFPVVNLSNYLNKVGDWESECNEISALLRQFGMLIVKDDRVDDSLNTQFLNMLEQYYEQPTEIRDQDARPDVHYQVGVTPEEIERARNHCQRIKGLSSTEKPLTEVSQHDKKPTYHRGTETIQSNTRSVTLSEVTSINN